MEKENIPKLFGSMIFNDKVMKSRLSKDINNSLKKLLMKM